MILRLNNREQEITRRFLRNNGVNVEGFFEVEMESIVLSATVVEEDERGVLTVTTEAELTLNKNVAMIQLVPENGPAAYERLLFPGQSFGPLAATVQGDPLTEYKFRVAILSVGSSHS